MNFSLGGNGNGKHLRMPKITMLPERNKPEPIQYNHVSDETINLHASRLLPKSEKLLFIDPKAIELPVKATPKLKVIVESMSKPVKKGMTISPQLLIGLGIMLVIVVIGLTILNNSVLEPAAEADREFQLQWQQQCAANPETCQLSPPPSSSGGGLFNFELPNPLAGPPSSRNK